MKQTEDKSPVEVHKIVIFGAGKIGRSLIGQLFGCSGYKIVFIEVNPTMVAMLNHHGKYRVVIKDENEEEIMVPHVQAICTLDKEKVIEAVSTAGILAVSVGKNALEKVIPVIAEGLIRRYGNHRGMPMDIILAENMRSAADFVRGNLKKNLPLDYPMENLIGLVETSIGKMVPIMTAAEMEKDPLVVFAERYNTLILDGKGFKSSLPDVKGLAPKGNIKAWVDRKAFIHNLGHATAAYYGYYRHPGAVYMYEVLDDCEVFRFTREVMLQSANILRSAYPLDFTSTDLENHIDDLLFRFRNKALQDTIFRVGHDLIRKLGSDDRFMGSIHLALQYQLPVDKILKAIAYGLFFRAKDEEGNMFQSDVIFLEALKTEFEFTMTEDLVLDPITDRQIVEVINKQYKEHLHDLKS